MAAPAAATSASSEGVMTVALAAASTEARRRRKSRPAVLSAGDRVSAWRVDYELGRGGMASVYAVTHTGFGKRAALKLCHPAILGPTFTFETFLREARIVHMIDHPGVVDVFATGTFDGRPYLAMERLGGETLGQRVDRGMMTRPEAIDVLIELCEVLRAAHEAGVVHRDLKLDNVFLVQAAGQARRIKLLDWGVARILSEPDPMAGMVCGTLTYVAPEQVRGEDVGTAADIYSLGVLAYQMLLGEPPFAAKDDLELIKKHLYAEAPEPQSLWSEIPRPLATLLVRMLDKEPANRPAIPEIVRGLCAAREALRPRPRWYTRMFASIAGLFGQPRARAVTNA